MRLDSHVVAEFRALPAKDRAQHLSLYSPDDRTKARIAEFRSAADRADRIRATAYEEFGGLTLQRVLDRDRKAFNSHLPGKSGDPEDDWKADTVRPVTRNKVISIAAHVTSSLLFPQVFAQNDSDDEDRDAADVMRDLVAWANDRSDYARVFVKGIVKALVDPALVVQEGYADVMRRVKVLKEDGKWEEKEVRDEVFSGFLNLIVPCEELYISNFYESDIQKQPFLVRQRFVDFATARAKYGHLADFKFVEPGIRVFGPEDDGAFYRRYDDDLADGMVEELTWYDRFADLELRFVNGILMDDPDRPLQRQDKLYPFAKTGYEYLAGTDCFYYKSLAAKMSSDQEVIDALYNLVIDGTVMKVMPPAVVIGDEDVDSSVVVPGSVTTFAEGSSFQAINTNNDLNAGIQTLQMVERSLAESSADRLSQGMSGEGTPATAFEVSRLESNARTMLGLFGKMVASFVEDFGRLRVGTVLQHMAVAEAAEVVGGTARVKFAKFLLPPQAKGDRPRQVEFDVSLPEDDEGRMEKSFELLEREHETGSEIALVNPEAFRRNKYLFKVKADFMPEQSEAVRKALNLEAYDRAIQNPYADQEKVTREFLFESYRPGEGERYMRKESPAPQAAAAPGNSNVTSQILNRAVAGQGV